MSARTLRAVASVTVVTVVLAACSGSSSDAQPSPSSTMVPATTSPSDRPGSIDVGMFTFDPLDDESQEIALLAQLDEAVDAGLNVIPLYYDWPVDVTEAQQPLDIVQAYGARPFIMIGVAEGLERNMPTPEEWSTFLEDFVPLITPYEPLMLSFGNEVEFQTGEPERFAGYIDEARARLDAHDVPVGTTFSGGYLLDPEPPAPSVAPILEVSTAAGLNTYCPATIEDGPLPVTGFAAELDRMEAELGDLPIHVQEFGCPSTFGLPHQADAIEFQMRTFAERSDRYDSVILFKHYDFDTPFCEDFEQLFVDEGIPVDHPDVRAFIESACALGVVNAETAAPRPAWDAFLRWIPCVRSARTDC